MKKLNLIAIILLITIILAGIFLFSISKLNFEFNNVDGNLVMSRYLTKTIPFMEGLYLEHPKVWNKSWLLSQGTHKDFLIQKSNYNVYVEESPNYIDKNVLDSINESIKFWEKRNDIKFTIVNNEKDSDFTIKWVKEFSGEVLGHTDKGKIVQIGLGDSNCNGEWKEYSSDSIQRIIEHEVGHVLGYQHVNDSSDVMYPEIKPKYMIDIDKHGFVFPEYAQYYGLCSRYLQAKYSVDIKAESDLEIYVGTKEELEKLQNGEKINTLNEMCDSHVDGMYSGCHLINDNLIIILNPSNQRVEYDLEVRQN
ncbi:MAG: matrixin family metalloprotease [Nanoarchaeota archaeon]